VCIKYKNKSRKEENRAQREEQNRGKSKEENRILHIKNNLQ